MGQYQHQVILLQAAASRTLPQFRRTSWSATMVAMKAMKAGVRAMSQGDMGKKIAESAGLKPKEVKGVLAALAAIATAEVKKTEKFVIPQIAMLKLKHKPARKAGKKIMFGKEVKVAAKPATKVVKAFAAKALKDSI